jgi:hypothetical protein
MTCRQFKATSKLAVPFCHGKNVTEMKPVAIHAQSPEVQCSHCRLAMRLIRQIDLTGLPNIYVFYCQRCQHVETVKEKKAA